MKTLLLTNEFPPHVYGGAGVHVEFLSAELARLVDVEVRCFGDQDVEAPRLRVEGFGDALDVSDAPPALRPALSALGRNLAFTAQPVDADVVHCHTWYSHLGGILVKLAYGIPLVVTVHSLEPLRPWKREQLRGGYDVSSWVERTALEMADAVIAVSEGTRDDVLGLFDVASDRVHVIHNGIDPELYRPVPDDAALVRYGVSRESPYVLFVGRITRQKGILHLLRAAHEIDQAAQLVLVASSPDTPEMAAEVEEAVAQLQAVRGGVIWVRDVVSRSDAVQLYTHAAVFCCPSVYEPFGIINLEAMACETPVVASAVGGIPEVVVDGQTGYLVPVDLTGESTFEPSDPGQFSRELAEGINRLLQSTTDQQRMGRAGRKRVVEHFAWSVIARQTADLYESVVRQRRYSR